MRLALLSTPRSGNTWLRYLLASTYRLQQYAVHSPEALNWSGLPDDCIVQLHWRRDEDFANFLTANKFQVVTISRHPLDVLLSILHFCVKEPDTRHWLSEIHGSESAICGRSPLSSEFLSYATGLRAEALLSVTPSWWCQENVLCVRYEELAAAPSRTLESLCASLGPVEQQVAETVNALTVDKLRPTSQNDHFWQGCPGLWQRLLPNDIAISIARAHAPAFAALTYTVERSVSPNFQQAETLWEQLV